MPHDFAAGFDLLHSTDTLRLLAARGEVLENRPLQPETWEAIRHMEELLLQPLFHHVGPFHISYGFAGPTLLRAIRAQAFLEGRNPQIAPHLDQHCGYERSRSDRRICTRDGLAVDLRVPDRSSDDVAAWIIKNLPFDRLYLYGPDRPLHLSWAPQPLGQVVRLTKGPSGRLIPRVLFKGTPSF
ncbi:MAG TPA: hypothetical protein PKY30_09665 [Myxococcota bacterium]|nr:hypothetical protein [Myxococcota bacterium]